MKCTPFPQYPRNGREWSHNGVRTPNAVDLWVAIKRPSILEELVRHPTSWYATAYEQHSDEDVLSPQRCLLVDRCE
jgi:hypothetical protein